MSSLADIDAQAVVSFSLILPMFNFIGFMLFLIAIHKFYVYAQRGDSIGSGVSTLFMSVFFMIIPTVIKGVMGIEEPEKVEKPVTVASTMEGWTDFWVYLGYGVAGIFAFVVFVFIGFFLHLLIQYYTIKRKTEKYLLLSDDFITISNNLQKIDKLVETNRSYIKLAPDFLTNEIQRINILLIDKQMMFNKIVYEYKKELETAL